MIYIKYLFVGVFFGIVLTKSEAISWYRIYEMFCFHSFHMYGIICTAIITGFIGIQIIKKRKISTLKGEKIEFKKKDKSFYRYILGGTFFGLGWGLVGACPGPIFILLGTGMWSISIVLIGALIGTYTYGILKKRLIH